MDKWDTPSFILLWDEKFTGSRQQGFFILPTFSDPEYIRLKHPSDLTKVTQIIEDNITKLDSESLEEAKQQARDEKLPLLGGSSDYALSYLYRYRASVHGVPNESWMTDFVNGELTRLMESYGPVGLTNFYL